MFKQKGWIIGVINYTIRHCTGTIYQVAFKYTQNEKKAIDYKAP